VNETVIKVSSGAVFNIPICKVVNLNSAVDELKSKGFTIIGTSSHGRDDFKSIKNVDKLCLIMGNEERGIRKSIIAKCDYIVNIHGYGKTESLNVATATGISIFELKKILEEK